MMQELLKKFRTEDPYEIAFRTLTKRQDELLAKVRRGGLTVEEQQELERSYSEIGVMMFRWDIASAQQHIEIVSGWLSPLVYNQVAGDMERALEQKPNLEIDIVVGPKILVDEREGNRVWEMFKEGRWGDRLQIYPIYALGTSVSRRRLIHIRMVDREGPSAASLLVEEPHRNPQVSPRQVQYNRRGPFSRVSLGLHRRQDGNWGPFWGDYFENLLNHFPAVPQFISLGESL